MPNDNLSAFKFFRMWPGKLFKKKKNGHLLIRSEAPELQRPGVYVLYKGEELYYVGQAQRLYSRLHAHANRITDGYYAHWNYFSAFALDDSISDHTQKLAELEAILIAAMPRSRNRATPRFAKVKIPRALMLDDVDENDDDESDES